MYYVIEVSRWCIALHRETKMRLIYRRDYIPDGDCGAISWFPLSHCGERLSKASLPPLLQAWRN